MRVEEEEGTTIGGRPIGEGGKKICYKQIQKNNQNIYKGVEGDSS